MDIEKLTPYADWLRLIGASRTTGHRYRKKGWIKTVNRAGKLYIEQKEHALFIERQANGEFARIGNGQPTVVLHAGRAPRKGTLARAIRRLFQA